MSSNGRYRAIRKPDSTALRRGYIWGLRRVMIWRRATLAVAILSIVLSVVLYIVVPKGFFPIEDTGQIFAFTEAAQDISFQAMVEHQKMVARRSSRTIPTSPTSIPSSAPPASARRSNNGRLFIQLKPRSERSLNGRRGDPGIAAASWRSVPGMNTYLPAPAEHSARRAAGQERLPIHAAGRRHDRALPIRHDHAAGDRARCRISRT